MHQKCVSGASCARERNEPQAAQFKIFEKGRINEIGVVEHHVQCCPKPKFVSTICILFLHPLDLFTSLVERCTRNHVVPSRLIFVSTKWEY